ncbi:hypothetical protein [Streptomyces sp. NPDC005438]|uniref:hypothetical protein n=1 Tax=Streptomyces sp. NPDC005438 TaxID=3156880 RepID=UPI0033ACEA08
MLFTGWAVLEEPGAGSVAGLCFALFAVLEHVNYFHVQLMYDNPADLRALCRNGLRRAHLARDLAFRPPAAAGPTAPSEGEPGRPGPGARTYRDAASGPG